MPRASISRIFSRWNRLLNVEKEEDVNGPRKERLISQPRTDSAHREGNKTLIIPKTTAQSTQSTSIPRQISVETSTKVLTGLLSLPSEIRQQILSYIVDPTSLTLNNTHLILKHRQAAPLLAVCSTLRADTHYLETQWHQQHSLTSVLANMWSDQEEEAYQNLQATVSAGKAPEGARTLLDAMNVFRGQRHEMMATIEAYKEITQIQREVLRELREENERLNGLVEMACLGDGT